MASFMITVPKAVGDAWPRNGRQTEVVGELIVNDRESALLFKIYVWNPQ
jgi:hypothetical protein